MTINELEKELKYAEKCHIEYSNKYFKFRRIPFLSKFYKNMYHNWKERHADLFKELREVMQKEFPENFIGNGCKRI